MLTRRHFLTGCVSAIAAISGFPIFSECKKLAALFDSIPILLYHRVGTEPDDLTVSTKRFREDMEFLTLEGYNTLSLEQVKRHVRDPLLPLPDRPIVITFDDGYLDNYTNAYPILQKYSMKASFYIITGMVGQTDRLSAYQIREMESTGMDFGSHTITHRPLAELGLEEVATELKKSKYDLEQIVGKSVDFMAYPCGSYSQDTLRIGSEAGYAGGFSVRPGFAMFDNRLAINRMPIFHSDKSMAYVMFNKGLVPDLSG